MLSFYINFGQSSGESISLGLPTESPGQWRAPPFTVSPCYWVTDANAVIAPEAEVKLTLRLSCHQSEHSADCAILTLKKFTGSGCIQSGIN